MRSKASVPSTGVVRQVRKTGCPNPGGAYSHGLEARQLFCRGEMASGCPCRKHPNAAFLPVPRPSSPTGSPVFRYVTSSRNSHCGGCRVAVGVYSPAERLHLGALAGHTVRHCIPHDLELLRGEMRLSETDDPALALLEQPDLLFL